MENIKNFLKIKTVIILAGGKGKRMINFSALPNGLKKQGFNPEYMHKSMIPVTLGIATNLQSKKLPKKLPK